MATQSQEILSQVTKCHHCQEVVVTPFKDQKDHSFCCHGCLSVYQILHQSNLEEFYNIQKQTGEYTKPVSGLEQKDFSYLKDQEFLKTYAVFDEQTKQWSLSFYLKGVHCLACLWLIEKLPEISPTVASSRLDMGKSLVTIHLKEGQNSFQEAATNLNNLGYEPYPISNLDELSQQQKKEERSLLLKIGIAGFSTMNIMLYTGSVYAGADGAYQLSFGILSLLLAIPVVFYSALPFYRSSLGAIKSKRVNIDIPLSFAILFGFFVSVYFVAINRDQFYFDSITTLIFLILLSRYVLKKAQQTNLNKNDILSLFQRGTIHKLTSLHQENGLIEDIHPDQLKVGDLIEVRPSEVIPCDGVIRRGKTRLNLSTLTGESESIFHGIGSQVFMGTSNVGETVVIEVLKLNEETRIGLLLNKVTSEEEKRSSYSYITDKVSRYFVNIVFSLAVVAFSYFFYFYGLEKALETSLAFIIVTCPCALGLATPLSFSRMMSLAQKKGLIFKNESALERLSHTQNIFFDKTGTLTTGRYEVSRYNHYNKELSLESITRLIFSLESNSKHPVAKAIVNWCAQSGYALEVLSLEATQEVIGKGVEATFQGDFYSISSRDQKDGKIEVVLNKNGQTIFGLTLCDRIRNDAQDTLKLLRKHHMKTFLLSGDKESVVTKVSQELQFKPEKVMAECTPEDKARFISQFPHSLFVGDGANDSLALSKATTSIATHSSIEVSLRVSDVFLGQDNLKLIPLGIELAKKTMKTVKLNLGFSLMYNSIGATLALGGFIGPLEAAVLMPLSSLTVLFITLFQTRDLKEEVLFGNP